MGCVLGIECDDNIAYSTNISNISIVGYLGYIHIDIQTKYQITWAVVCSMMLNSEIDIDDVVDNCIIFCVYY
jgi:hypothetical protein